MIVARCSRRFCKDKVILKGLESDYDVDLVKILTEEEENQDETI